MNINVREIYLGRIREPCEHCLSLIQKPQIVNRRNAKLVKESMKVFNYTAVRAKDAEGGAHRVNVRWLISRAAGAPNFAMRLFEVEPNGYSPLHNHPWEHEVFILEGEGVVFDGEKETHFNRNDVVFVPRDELHQFKNIGTGTLKFLCLIPHPKE